MKRDTRKTLFRGGCGVGCWCHFVGGKVVDGVKRKYRVTMFFNATKTVEVEAESSEEAVPKAVEEHGDVSLCWQCSREVDDYLQPDPSMEETVELIDEKEGDLR